MNDSRTAPGKLDGSLTTTAGDTLCHAVRAREAVLGIQALTADSVVLQMENDAEIRQVARALNIPIRHRQLRHVLANLADILLDDISAAHAGNGANVVRAFSPERDLRLWDECGIVPIGAYHEAAAAIACARNQPDAGEARLQLLRCLLADAYCALLVEHIATTALTGECTGAAALGAFHFPATENLVSKVGEMLA